MRKTKQNSEEENESFINLLSNSGFYEIVKHW